MEGVCISFDVRSEKQSAYSFLESRGTRKSSLGKNVSWRVQGARVRMARSEGQSGHTPERITGEHGKESYARKTRCTITSPDPNVLSFAWRCTLGSANSARCSSQRTFGHAQPSLTRPESNPMPTVEVVDRPSSLQPPGERR